MPFLERRKFMKVRETEIVASLDPQNEGRSLALLSRSVAINEGYRCYDPRIPFFLRQC